MNIIRVKSERAIMARDPMAIPAVPPEINPQGIVGRKAALRPTYFQWRKRIKIMFIGKIF